MISSHWFLSNCPLKSRVDCPEAVGDVEDVYKNDDPSIVFIHASRWTDLAILCKEFLTLKHRQQKRRILIEAGTDQKLSRNIAKVRHFLQFFDHIFYEAKDIPTSGVNTMPVGLAEHYLRGLVHHASALLVLTVPIVMRNPATKDLQRYGFPIVVIGSMEEISASSLPAWWSQMAPRLTSFRDNCATAEGYWKMLQMELPYCS